MKLDRSMATRLILVVSLVTFLSLLSSRMRADTGTCGGEMITLPFIDVAGNPFFCTIAAAYFTGLTNGTDATHYGPSANVTRDQMSAFITRALDQAVKRSSPRLALRRAWNTQTPANLQTITVGNSPNYVESDGEDLWVANNFSDTVTRVHASNGKVLGTWTGATSAFAVLCAMGRVYVTGLTGKLYQIDPTQSSGSVITLSSSLDLLPKGIAYDGRRIWTANEGGSVSIITVDGSSVHTATTGFTNPHGIIFDGTNIWVTDRGDDTLKKLGSSGNILMSVNVGLNPRPPAFDGTNIWVPDSNSNSVTVVRATGGIAGTALATLTGNGLDSPVGAAFDGERILIINRDSVSLWKASDFTAIGTFPIGAGTGPRGVCSDGVNFWITLQGPDQLARY